jgi:hypothetical protein
MESKVVFLQEPDQKHENEKMDETEVFRRVGSSVAKSIGDAVDVTRMEKDFAQSFSSVREECERGLSVFLTETELEHKEKEFYVWSYLLTPGRAVLQTIIRPCSAIANITILFRGRADDGILTLVDSVYLTLNERVIDIASMAPNQEDRRVATFRGFLEANPFLFMCMSHTDELKIYIRFKKSPKKYGREMIRILADLFSFESQDDFRHQTWIQPLLFDTSQELFFDCSVSGNECLKTRGELSDSPAELAKRASRGWPHEMNDSESENSDSHSESESQSSKEDWKQKMQKLAIENENRMRSKKTVLALEHALYERRRAYSDEDIFHIERLFGVSGLSPEGEALCAIEIARWKTQKKILENELMNLT